LLSGMNL